MIDNIVNSGLTSVGIRGCFRQTHSAVWDVTLDQLDFVPVAYSHAEINYQLSYLQSGIECQDISLILYHDNGPCGIWPLCYMQNDGVGTLGSYLDNGRSLLPPLFVSGMADKTKKSITRKCLDFVEIICKDSGVEKWQSAESYIGRVGLSEWHEQSLQRGATASLRHELFVDLTLDMVTIKAKIRKSFKSLITEGMRTWKVGVLNGANPELWESFRMLHQKAAGRVTRSIETWDLQYQAIVSRHAFLVHLHNDESELVGGGYFAVTRDQGVYNVGAYDRNLFDHPLGHVVQYRAIEEMKARGLRWYKIGFRCYPQDDGVNEKEVSISEFKQGFATHLIPQYVLQTELKS